MTKTALSNALRNDVLAALMDFVATKYDVDVLTLSTSSFTFPTVDAEGNEAFAKISVSIPRGNRNGKGGYDDFDGYAAAEDFKLEQEEKAAKKAKREAENEAKRKLKEAKKSTKEGAE